MSLVLRVNDILIGVNALYGVLVEAGADENVVDIVRLPEHCTVTLTIDTTARKVSHVLQGQPQAHPDEDRGQQEARPQLHPPAEGRPGLGHQSK